MTRPQHLPDDLAEVKAAGVDTVVSLLEPTEAAQVGLSTESQTCTQLGLTFLNHPIRDMHLPEPQAFREFCTDIAAQIRDGRHVAVHCHASIGRSGMLACTVIGHFGFDAQSALDHVTRHRGVPVPDTQAQTAFIHAVRSL